MQQPAEGLCLRCTWGERKRGMASKVTTPGQSVIANNYSMSTMSPFVIPRLRNSRHNPLRVPLSVEGGLYLSVPVCA